MLISYGFVTRWLARRITGERPVPPRLQLDLYMAKARFRIVPYRILPSVDWILIGVTLALAAFGVLTLWGATLATPNGPGPLTMKAFATKQIIFFLVGLVALVTLVIFDYQILKRIAWIIWMTYGVLILLLLGLLVKGHAIKGAEEWYNLGFFNFQPSEPGKLIVILALAQYLAPRVRKFRGIRHTIVPLMIVGVPMLLILKQPDLGSAAVFIPVTAAMFWAAGLRKYVFITFFLLGIGVCALGYPHLKEYQKQRLKTFIDPSADPRGKTYNIMQSMITLGSGQLTGKGWGRGTQTNFKFLPEYHTDFIFPTLGEQFGMIGCGIVLLLMIILVARMAHLANETQDVFGVLIVTGLTAMFCTHVVLNIGMTIGLLPVTGLPLPFFSYGGTFVVTCMSAVGMAVGIGARRGL